MADRAMTIAKYLAPHLARGQSVLEIGAGKGLVAKALQQAAQIDIQLVDVVDYNQTDLELQVYDGVRLPFPDESFDYSLLIFVLHHTPDPIPLLGEALRVARNGVIVFENHVPGLLRQLITRFIDSLPHYQYGISICYRAQTMDVWLKLFEQLPVRTQALERFAMDSFWDNFVVLLKK